MSDGFQFHSNPPRIPAPVKDSDSAWDQTHKRLNGHPGNAQVGEHTGSKYLRKVPTNADGYSDVYAVLEAFEVTCPARQHAIKKLLCTGTRGKNDAVRDLIECRDAVARAIELQQLREEKS